MKKFIKRHPYFSTWVGSTILLSMPIFHGTSNPILLTIQGILFLLWLGVVWVLLGSLVYYLQNLVISGIGKHLNNEKED